MTYSIAANHAKNKGGKDKIFAASDAANKAIAQHGKANVINATIGTILDENEIPCTLPTIDKVYRSLSDVDLFQYAGIAGLPDFLTAVVDEACGNSKPNAHIQAVGTAGGTGALHHAIWNYANEGDKILGADRYWGAYSSICRDMLRSLETYEMFDENNNYNVKGMLDKINQLAKVQDNVVVIINTPAHNPVGYTVTNQEWDEIIAGINNIIEQTGKNIIVLVDLAYLDYAGDREQVRSFMKKFENLPKQLMIVLIYSMSKGFTIYGQRTGAMICISSDKDVADEFKEINSFTSRATWSNINRPGMQLLVNICKDKALHASVCQERSDLFQMIKERADIFSQEAKEVGLDMLPYRAGFFISVNSKDSDAVCEKLKEENVFVVPLAKAVRVAVCGAPKSKIKGLAAKIKKAIDQVDK